MISSNNIISSIAKTVCNKAFEFCRNNPKTSLMVAVTSVAFIRYQYGLDSESENVCIKIPKEKCQWMDCPIPRDVWPLIISQMISEGNDPVNNFKMIANLSRTNRYFYDAIENERAKIINSNPQIYTIKFFNNSFKAMLCFAKCYGVNKLNLSHLKVTDKQVEELLEQMPELVHLNISFSTTIHRITQLCPAMISNLSNLKTLELEYCMNLKPEMIKKFMICLPKLAYLNLRGSSFLDPEVITHLKNLTYLNISNCRIRETDLSILAEKNPNLIQLDISKCRSIDGKDLDIHQLRAIFPNTDFNHV